MKARLLAACVLVVIVACLCEIGCRRRPSGAAVAGPEMVLDDANFQGHVLESSQPVLVDFFATWCGPCRAMAPLVEEVAAEFVGKAVVGKVDVDRSPALAARYQITGIPTFVIFKNGEEVERLVGMRPKEELSARLAALAGK